MSTTAGTHACWWIARTVTTLASTRTRPQRPTEHLERLRHARDILDTATNPVRGRRTSRSLLGPMYSVRFSY
jgi:hypothetical protein